MNLNNQNDNPAKTANNMNIRGTNPPRAARYPAGKNLPNTKAVQAERPAAPAAVRSQPRQDVQIQTASAPSNRSLREKKKGLTTLEKVLIILLVAVIISAAVITVLTASRSSVIESPLINSAAFSLIARLTVRIVPSLGDITAL